MDLTKRIVACLMLVLGAAVLGGCNVEVGSSSGVAPGTIAVQLLARKGFTDVEYVGGQVQSSVLNASFGVCRQQFLVDAGRNITTIVDGETIPVYSAAGLREVPALNHC